MTPEDQQLFEDIQKRIIVREQKRAENLQSGVLKPVRQRKQRMPPLADDLETLMSLFKKYLLKEPDRANPE